ncbi:hypothetical protein M0C34_12610 [Agarivorans sp. TSD2052]|uniref:hypothetical protein n=1 Tax=Agarivorans sp. TSD2052 TaxID=2937286 RepID=UPI00201093DB|nr:hypothetical protein [Agarivorans sp. TSD2052]UPW17090.1 hypothetical protein M0C34_12610 [Agarivorans sp. TSD2052]
MNEHTPYQERLNRNPDFIVEYVIDLSEELKGAKLGQGMRVDFLYEGDNPQTEGVHMIWPEILDSKGDVILDTVPGNIPQKGKANMWIVDETRRPYHANRIKVGTNGIWWRGGRVAFVKVVNIEGLQC